MARVTKEQMMEKLGALEDKLFDVVPENEVETKRAKILDRVSEIVSGNVMATLAEMQSAFKEGSGLLAVEAEVKKAEKKQAKEDVADEKPKKKVSKKKSEPKAEDEEETALVPAKKNEVAKKSNKKVEKEDKFEFPKVLETEEEGNFELITIKDLSEIQEDDLIAGKWTKEDLAEWEYDEVGVFGQPEHFEKDIDVCVIVDNAEYAEGRIVYAQSVGTGRMYYFLQDMIKKMDCKGMPFRVYRKVA